MGKALQVTGGADAKFEVDLESDKKSFFDNLKSTKSFTRSSLDANDQKVLEQLLTAEIIVPKLEKKGALKVGVLGDDFKLNIDNKEIRLTNKKDQADIILVFRTNSSYGKLLSSIDYQEIDKPNLFIDLAYHHTVSVGPLVFPGETACIACLQGRVTTRWGDDVPPKKPNITADYQLICGLIESELIKILKGDTSLTNKTVSWNFQDRFSKTNQLLKVPICPICNRNKLAYAGSLELPWIKA